MKTVCMLGTDHSNPGDTLVHAGCVDIVRSRFPDAYLRDEHTETFSMCAPADVLVVCGCPWIHCGGHTSDRVRRLQRVRAQVRPKLTIALGIGATIQYGQKVKDAAQCAKAMFGGFDEVYVRDPQALAACRMSGINAVLEDCPSFRSTRTLRTPRPQKRGGRCHIYQDIRRSFLRNALARNADLTNFLDAVQNQCVAEADGVLCLIGADADSSGGARVVGDIRELFSHLGRFVEVTSMRVHGAIAARAMGADAWVIPMDSRASAAERFGVKMYPAMMDYWRTASFGELPDSKHTK